VSGVPDGPRPSIVLVDDSRDVRALVRRRLQASGFDVVGEGEDGDEAIMLAHRHQPALLVLDTSMPRVDGIEALPVILAVSPETKVVIFTGFESRRLPCGLVSSGPPTSSRSRSPWRTFPNA